ncbi:ABC transporter substrate-binding protein [Nocardioides sp. Kera G14]|uniref:ABC transporter substrate-binding protein n=1 Tax=Nocardioides sp. Kera G14 TaxID=2884264 RepID=UPI001D12ECDB|nr:ABC transporter substrate-binding protein [Nocardioides sp. Kera G14]UDY24609.1 ABC transporter substrate-binding protein [Nocardioides sp. Kera G14]
MNRKSRIAAAAGLVLATSSLAACGGNSSAGDSGGTVTIMVGGIDKVIYLPAMLTQQLGYFKDEGVKVKLMTEPSGANAETELVAHKVEGVVGFYDHTVTLAAQGQCVESVAQLAKVPGEVEMVSTKASGITGAGDFKGKKLGVTSAGSSTDYLTRYLATKNGVDPKDYTTVNAGAGSTFVAALQQGAIDAGMTTDPTVETALNQGVGKVLLDMRTEEGTKAALGGLYPAASLYMDCDYVRDNPKTVQKVTNAFVKTLSWIGSHSAADIAAKMPADYAGGDAATYEKAIDSTKGIFTTDGVMPSDGPKTVLDVLGTFSDVVKPKKDSLDLSKTYTTTFVDAAK